jgi:hypothetical protein
MTDDFFCNRLDQMIDLRHPLAVLANRMPWQEIEASLVQRLARQVKAGKKIEDLDLFDSVSVIAGGGGSNAGRPRLPTRLMVALLFLKQVAVTLKLIAKKELTRVIVDSTVQKKAVAHPTDSKLLETSRFKVVDNRAKLCNWHASEVKCISKGKNRNPYEFGVKIGLGMTLKGNLIVGAWSFPGNRMTDTPCTEQNDRQERLGPFVAPLQESGLTGLFEKLAEILGLKREQNSDKRFVLA